MNTRKQNITFLAAIILLTNVLYTPNTRFILNMSAKYAHQAAWLVPAASLILFIPYIYIIYRLTKAFEGQSLSTMLHKVFGKVIAKILCVITLLWLMVLLGMYIKYSGEKLVSTVYVGTDLRLLIFIVVAMISVMLRWGLEPYERMSKIIFIVCVIQFLFICIMILTSSFTPRHVTPISTLDVGPIAKSAQYPMVIIVYLTFMLIFNDQIKYNKKRKYIFAGFVAFEVIFNTILVLAVLGMFGWELTDKMAFPFLKATENIQIGGNAAGLESLFLAIWMMLELMLIIFFTYIIVKLIKDIFGLARPVPALTAVLGFGYYFAIYICNDSFELTVFSEYVAAPGNLILGLGIPVLLFLTAKVRKLL